MALRLKDIRIAFRKALEDLGAPGTWKHITDQCGVFIYLNLTGKCKILFDVQLLNFGNCIIVVFTISFITYLN